MPIPTDVSELEEEARGVISKEAMRVQFALRHKFDARKNIEQLDKVFAIIRFSYLSLMSIRLKS